MGMKSAPSKRSTGRDRGRRHAECGGAELLGEGVARAAVRQVERPVEHELHVEEGKPAPAVREARANELECHLVGRGVGRESGVLEVEVSSGCPDAGVAGRGRHRDGSDEAGKGTEVGARVRVGFGVPHGELEVEDVTDRDARGRGVDRRDLEREREVEQRSRRRRCAECEHQHRREEAEDGSGSDSRSLQAPLHGSFFLPCRHRRAR